MFSTILQSDLSQGLFEWYWNGLNSLLLATKGNLRQIPVVPLLTDSEPIYRFVMHHNSITVNCGTRERTCATNMMRSTHWQLLFLVAIDRLLDAQTTTISKTKTVVVAVTLHVDILLTWNADIWWKVKLESNKL